MVIAGDKLAKHLYYTYHNDELVTETGEIKKVARPKVEVIFKRNVGTSDAITNPEFRTYALVDSGADLTFIPREIADLLKLNLNEENKRTNYSASGQFDTYNTKAFVELINEGKIFPLDDLIDVVVPEKYSGDINDKNYGYFNPILLGRSGFFDKYIVTFNETEKKLDLRYV